MLSYHNDQSVKDRHVAMAKKHAKLAMLISGTYGKGVGKEFKACSVGCFAHEINPESNSHHKIVADDAGWPLWLVYLNDRIFEGLENGERAKFHVDLREAVPVGVDLEKVHHLLAVRRNTRFIELLKRRLGKRSKKHDQIINDVIAAIEVCQSCHEAEAGGNVCDWSAARGQIIAARATAAAAYADTAAAYADAAAAYAVDACAVDAYAYAYACACAVDAYAYACACAAARKNAWRAERDGLLDILRNLT